MRIVTLTVLAACSCAAAERPYAAVIEKVAGAVAFLSAGGEQLGQVKVGAFPHEAALSEDGRLLYVSVNGVLWMTEDAIGGNTIAVVDVASMKKLYDIDLGRFHRPHGIALSGGKLLATTERPFGVVLVDPATRKVIRDYDVKGKSPHMVFPSPDGRLAFASNSDSDSVAAIDLKAATTTVIPTPAHPQGGVFSPDAKRLYITCMNANQLAIIDTAALRVTGTIATGKGPARMALTPDGRTLVYNLGFEPGVGFADVATGKETGIVKLSGRPLSLTMSPDGRRAFAGIQDQDKVVFISVPDRKIERVIELPKDSGPDPVIPLVQ
jgi:YVTN family beta-propeller protein